MGLKNKKIKVAVQERLEKSRKRRLKMSFKKGQFRDEHEEKVEKIILDMQRKGFLGYSFYNPKRR